MDDHDRAADRLLALNRSRLPRGKVVMITHDSARLCRNALSTESWPILVVRVLPAQSGEKSEEHRPFRVIAVKLWSVENNLNLANMFWSEFADAAGPDGVFRGFGG